MIKHPPGDSVTHQCPLWHRGGLITTTASSSKQVLQSGANKTKKAVDGANTHTHTQTRTLFLDNICDVIWDLSADIYLGNERLNKNLSKPYNYPLWSFSADWKRSFIKIEKSPIVFPPFFFLRNSHFDRKTRPSKSRTEERLNVTPVRRLHSEVATAQGDAMTS